MIRPTPRPQLWLAVLLLLGEALSLGACIPDPDSRTDGNQKHRGPAPIHLLRAGEALQQAVKEDESLDYEILLERGQFFSADLRPLDTDVLVTLFDPAGWPILAVEGTSGLPAGPLIAIAGAPGVYRLRVRAVLPGEFSLRLDHPRMATSSDEPLAAAARLISQNGVIRRLVKGKSCSGVVPSYGRALEAWRADLDRKEIALTYYWLGRALQTCEQQAEARNAFNESYERFRDAGDPAAAAVALERVAETYYFAGEGGKAAELYRRSIEEFRRVSNRAGEAGALCNLALVEKEQERIQDALEDYGRALGILRALGHHRDEAILLSNMGQLYLNMERPADALAYFQQALSLQGEAAGQADPLPFLFTDVGLAQSRLGSYSEAIQNFQKAIDLGRRSGDERSELSALLNLGYAYLGMKQWDTAARYLEQSAALARKVGDRRQEAFAIAYRARMHSLQDDPQGALQSLEKVLPIFREMGDERSEGFALYGMAVAQQRIGRLEAGLKTIQGSITLGESHRTSTPSQDLRSSNFIRLRERYELQIDLLMELHRRDPAKGLHQRAFESSEVARARSVLDELAEAHTDIRAGVPRPLLDREEELLRKIHAKETEKDAWLAKGVSSVAKERLAALTVDMETLLRSYDRVQAEIRAESPRYAALVQPEPLGLAEIQRELLDKDTLLLSYFMGERRSFLWAVDWKGFRSFELPARSQIEAGARALREKLSQSRSRVGQGEVALAAARLGRMILPAALGALKVPRLLISPDGALQYVPFGALPEPGVEGETELLVERHEIVELPSASAVSLLRKARGRRHFAPLAIAMFADSVFGADDQRVHRLASESNVPSPEGRDLRRLVYSREEAEAILALAPPGKSFAAFGFEANLDTLRRLDLTRFRNLHFATHGMLDSGSGLSGIYLSRVDEQGRRRDGFLPAIEIYNLDLSADLVVLSACNTALGDDLQEEGVGRLTRAFLYAGAKSVVVSLWSVSDKPTAKLMEFFYRGMFRDGLSPAAALRAAQCEIRRKKNWAAPYYWAGFVLQGDWGQGSKQNRLSGVLTSEADSPAPFRTGNSR